MVVLHIGDVVGRLGRRTLADLLPGLIEQHAPGLVIVNGENVAGGTGITASTAEELLAAGADCITTGNHVWAQREAYELVERESRILRPANYPPGVPGRGALVLAARHGDVPVGVINLCGRVFMRELDCPFRGADAILQWMRRETPVIVVDFHAEATSEKQALGRHLDGRVSAVIGTHTHVQTADEGVLAGGTAYITDVGMTGPTDSIIGVQTEPVLKRFLMQIPSRFEPPTSGPTALCGVAVDVDPTSGKAWSIQRIRHERPAL
ncbi:MAG: TIGR00282 family metallophosphoesterase [Armatimonadota bacterium]